MKTKNTYRIRILCRNCDFDGDITDSIEIEKGKKVNEVKCPRCGCKTLKRIEI